jgi:hypothetical protein
MLRKYIYDPGLWMLVLLNLYVIWYYTGHPAVIHTLIALFWIQSVLIGLFNAVNIFTLTNTVPGSFEVNQQPGNRQGCAGIFFLLHYGFFHLVYIFFLIPSVIDLRQLDYGFLRISIWILVVCSTIEFIRDKFRNRSEAANIGAMFFLPYARIIPMHLIILLPSFIPVSSPILFLLLKMLSDIIMYVLYKRIVFRPLNPASVQ